MWIVMILQQLFLIICTRLIKMYCAQNPTLVEEPSICSYEGRRRNGIGKIFGAKSIAEATASIREELRKTYVAQMGRRMHEYNMKESQRVESNVGKDNISDKAYIIAKAESSEEEVLDTEACDNSSFSQQCLARRDFESSIIKNVLKPEPSPMSEKEVYLDVACEPMNILNSEEQNLSDADFAVGHCPTKSTSISTSVDSSLYENSVTVTGIFQNTAIPSQTNSCTGEENNQTADDNCDQGMFSVLYPEMSSFIPASEEIKEHSQPDKKTLKVLKETIIKEILDGNMEDIKDISQEDYLSPELILLLPSKQGSVQETFSQPYSSGKSPSSYTIRSKKFSHLSSCRKEYLNATRKKRFLSYQSRGHEESSGENSTSSCDESSSDSDWCEAPKDQHYISSYYPSTKTRKKCRIAWDKEPPISSSCLEESESVASCQRSTTFVPGIQHFLEALSSTMYQPYVYVVDCCKVKRSLKELFECRICLRGLRCSGFFSIASTCTSQT